MEEQLLRENLQTKLLRLLRSFPDHLRLYVRIVALELQLSVASRCHGHGCILGAARKASVGHLDSSFGSSVWRVDVGCA